MIVVDTNLRLFSLLESAGTGGNLTTDALIVAHAVEQAATVHSDDRDFDRFGGLRWHNPLASSTRVNPDRRPPIEPQAPFHRHAHSKAKVNVFGPLAVTSALKPDVAADA